MAGQQITIREAGPFFTGNPSAVIAQGLEQAMDDVAQAAYDSVQSMMAGSFQNPTGFYQGQVIVERAGDTRVVSDQGVIYGPWLEGVGSRNASTRFKGYFHWRRSAQAVNARARAIAEAAISRAVGRLQ